ncbi:MAG: hypothetical protein WAW46_15360 [Polaromonas sp.]
MSAFWLLGFMRHCGPPPSPRQIKSVYGLIQSVNDPQGSPPSTIVALQQNITIFLQLPDNLFYAALQHEEPNTDFRVAAT